METLKTRIIENGIKKGPKHLFENGLFFSEVENRFLETAPERGQKNKKEKAGAKKPKRKRKNNREDEGNAMTWPQANFVGLNVLSLRTSSGHKPKVTYRTSHVVLRNFDFHTL